MQEWILNYLDGEQAQDLMHSRLLSDQDRDGAKRFTIDLVARALPKDLAGIVASYGLLYHGYFSEASYKAQMHEAIDKSNIGRNRSIGPELVQYARIYSPFRIGARHFGGHSHIYKIFVVFADQDNVLYVRVFTHHSKSGRLLETPKLSRCYTTASARSLFPRPQIGATGLSKIFVIGHIF